MSHIYKTNFADAVALCGEVLIWARKLTASKSRELITTSTAARDALKVCADARAAQLSGGLMPDSKIRALVPAALAATFDLMHALDNATQSKNCRKFAADVRALRVTLYDDAPRNTCPECNDNGNARAVDGRCVLCGKVDEATRDKHRAEVDAAFAAPKSPADWSSTAHQAAPRVPSLPARQGVNPESLRDKVAPRAATLAELLADLEALRDSGAPLDVAPVLYDDAADDEHAKVDTVQLVAFRQRMRGYSQQVECAVINVDLPRVDALDDAVLRLRAESTADQVNAFAELVEWYCDEYDDGERLMRSAAYKRLVYGQRLKPVLQAVVAVLTDVDPDTGARRILYSRAVREAAALVLRAVTVEDWAQRCIDIADDLLIDEDAAGRAARAVELVEGVIDDVSCIDPD